MPHTDSLILALDLGTSGPKVAIFTVQGAIVASTNREQKLIFTADGGVEQDPELWWSLCKEAMHEVLASDATLRQRIIALGVTAQWAGTVAISSTGKTLGKSIIWMDARGAGAMRQLCGGPFAVEGYAAAKLAQWIYKTGGAPGLSGKDSLAHIHVFRERYPDLYAQARWFLEPKDYLNFLLTGQIASSLDTMTLHWVTNNRNLGAPRYDAGLLRLGKVDGSKLPPLKQASEMLGKITPALAREFGLAPSTAVVVSSPDVPAAAIGSGAIADYRAHLCLGTSAWLSCHVPFRKTGFAVKMATLPSAVPGRYLVANEQESAALCLQYLREVFLRGAGSQLWSFAELEAEAARSPAGSNQVLFTPWLNGERTPVDDHRLRGGFHNLGLKHTQADVIRAVYEGVAFNCRWLLQAVEGFIGRVVPSLHLIGGGAQSPLWCQILADVLGCEIKQVAEPRHANARGAAWLAAAGLGLLSFAEMEQYTCFAGVYTPNPRHRGVYDWHFREFLNLHRANRRIYHRLHVN